LSRGITVYQKAHLVFNVVYTGYEKLFYYTSRTIETHGKFADAKK